MSEFFTYALNRDRPSKSSLRGPPNYIMAAAKMATCISTERFGTRAGPVAIFNLVVFGPKHCMCFFVSFAKPHEYKKQHPMHLHAR